MGKKGKQGGQNGHKRHVCELIPSEQCFAVVDCIPEICRRCGGELQLNTTTSHRHQAWGLPRIQPIVIEYRQHRGNCPCCGITTMGALPDGASTPETQCPQVPHIRHESILRRHNRTVAIAYAMENGCCSVDGTGP